MSQQRLASRKLAGRFYVCTAGASCGVIFCLSVLFENTRQAVHTTAKTEQHKNRFKYGELYSLNYYKQVQEKGRSYYEVYSLQRSEEVPEDYKEIDFVCLRPFG